MIKLQHYISVVAVSFFYPPWAWNEEPRQVFVVLDANEPVI